WRPARPGTRSISMSSWPFRYAGGLTESTAHERARPLEILGGVDAERHAVDDRDVDAHAGFERPQLLELLTPFERRRRQSDKSGERRAPIGIEPDVVVERPLAERRSGAGEVEGAQSSLADRGADHLHHVGIAALLRARDLGG